MKDHINEPIVEHNDHTNFENSSNSSDPPNSPINHTDDYYDGNISSSEHASEIESEGENIQPNNT